METYTVLARRYRPRTFDEVVGQEHVARTLRNALDGGRVAHAYLFSGPRGVGKTTMARILAKALNCEKGTGASPCLECEPCRRIHAGVDHDVVEIDAASNRNVEDARLLRESVKYRPLRSPFKVYIIDEAHMLTRDAFNTLLKTLEEPPPHVKFVFATTEPQRLPETIVSRCQHFEFGRITEKHLVQRLRQICERERLPFPPEVLLKIATVARGGMRDAETLLEQLVAFRPRPESTSLEDVNRLVGAASDEAVLDLLGAVRDGDVRAVFERLAEIFSKGADPTAFADQSLGTLRVLLLIKACGPGQTIAVLPERLAAAAEELQKSFSIEALLYMMQLLLEARRRLREGLNPQIVLELSFAKMASISNLVSLGDALRALQGTAPAAAPLSSRPAPDPKPAGAAPSARPPAPSDLALKWDRVLEEIHERASVLDRTILRECTPVSLEGRSLKVAVPANLNNPMHRKNFQRTQSRGSPVPEAVEKVFGPGVRVEFLYDAPGAGGRRASVDITDDPDIKRIQEKFEGSRFLGPHS